MIYRHNVLRLTFSYKNTLTRISTTSRTLIDNIFSVTLLKISHQEIFDLYFWTFNPVFACNQHKDRDVPLQTKRECYFYRHFNNKNLKDETCLVDWEDSLQIWNKIWICILNYPIKKNNYCSKPTVLKLQSQILITKK